MKSLVFGLFLGTLSVASSAVAGSGSFCNESNQRIEWVCEQTPGGAGWVRQGDGCYHRNTGARCSQGGGGGGGIGNGGGGGFFPPRPLPPQDPGFGRVVCRAEDRGWEEHFSHRSCGECLREHGRCVETCGVTKYTCESQGYDFAGNAIRFIGQGETRYQAENQANANCSYNADSCHVLKCRSSEDVISVRECR